MLKLNTGLQRKMPEPHSRVRTKLGNIHCRRNLGKFPAIPPTERSMTLTSSFPVDPNCELAASKRAAKSNKRQSRGEYEFTPERENTHNKAFFVAEARCCSSFDHSSKATSECLGVSSIALPRNQAAVLAHVSWPPSVCAATLPACRPDFTNPPVYHCRLLCCD